MRNSARYMCVRRTILEIIITLFLRLVACIH